MLGRHGLHGRRAGLAEVARRRVAVHERLSGTVQSREVHVALDANGQRKLYAGEWERGGRRTTGLLAVRHRHHGIGGAPSPQQAAHEFALLVQRELRRSMSRLFSG
jgi:hypothetical protein